MDPSVFLKYSHKTNATEIKLIILLNSKTCHFADFNMISFLVPIEVVCRMSQANVVASQFFLYLLRDVRRLPSITQPISNNCNCQNQKYNIR